MGLRESLARFAHWRSARLIDRSLYWRRVEQDLTGITDKELNAADEDARSASSIHKPKKGNSQ